MKLAALVVLAACGSAPPKPHALSFETDDSAALVARASREGDVQTMRRLLGDKVTIGGLWFADAACAKEFDAPAEVSGAGLDELARCLATLKLETTRVREMLPDVVVMSYAPGIEVEVRLLGDKSDPQLVWIGYADARDASAPSITAETLETLRDAGDPHPAGDGFAVFHVCIDPTGHLASTQMRWASTLAASRALEQAVAAWHFRPFTLGGAALPACAVVTVGGGEDRPRLAPFATPHGEPMLWPSLHIVERGAPAFLPSGTIKLLRDAHIDRLVGGVMYCVDVDGHVYGARIVRSTGIPAYDQQLLASYSSMVLTPYRDGDKPVAFCMQTISETKFD